MIDDTKIENAAKELVERYGNEALAVVRERLDELRNSNNQPELDIALRVLSVVERLV